MELNKILDQIVWDLETLRNVPDSTISFNALEVTLQDWAQTAHGESLALLLKNKKK